MAELKLQEKDLQEILKDADESLILGSIFQIAFSKIRAQQDRLGRPCAASTGISDAEVGLFTMKGPPSVTVRVSARSAHNQEERFHENSCECFFRRERQIAYQQADIEKLQEEGVLAKAEDLWLEEFRRQGFRGPRHMLRWQGHRDMLHRTSKESL